MKGRLCVIGVGTFGEMHLRAGLQLDRAGEMELAGFADTNDELARRREKQYGIAGHTDWREMIQEVKPDAVTIATPDFLHKDIAVECLERGIHVLTEKPMDTSVDGCVAMIDAAEKADRLLQVNFMKRKDPYHLDLERRLRAGGAGQVLYGYAWFEDKIEVPTKWLPGWAAQSDPAWFLGVHLFDLIGWLIKARAVQVSATGAKVKIASMGIDTYDSIQSRVVYDNGASFTYDTAWHFPEGGEALVHQGIKIVGSEGWFTVDSQDRGARGCVGGATAAGVGGDQAPEAARMITPNVGLYQSEVDASGRTLVQGYAIDSISDYGRNVNFLLNGGSRAELAGRYPSGDDGLEATRIAVAIHDSLDAGGALISVG